MFDLREWESSTIPSGSTTSPVLGLTWDKMFDSLEIDSISLTFDEKEKITKRKILSLVSQVFDPIGFLAPVMIQNEEGILRLKSRLINEEESKDFISPTILPSKHLAVRGFIVQEHLPNKNARTLTPLAILRERFWIDGDTFRRFVKIKDNGLKESIWVSYVLQLPKEEIKLYVGDIVLIGTDKKRLHWLLGRVLELFPGKDGIIRLVKLQTERGDILRPIQRLYPLELTPKYETQKVPEVVIEYSELNTNSNETVPVMRNKAS
ncbi:DUF5641 domain-containing protein [Trichonephila clavata]|uniref:DUF5641 domain-containing protein n=1 Tax=Trichonephila clavata TaxID=2740835 RepID=A0A8X6GY88_TRICU|nr:DUF5641 domain-containing protein [Trichonephila clavata]